MHTSTFFDTHERLYNLAPKLAVVGNKYGLEGCFSAYQLFTFLKSYKITLSQLDLLNNVFMLRLIFLMVLQQDQRQVR
jgi:hypothetical protein